MSSNDASELRIAIARVLERWQSERMALDVSSVERNNLEVLDVRLRQLESGNVERWQELALLQAELIAALKRQLKRNARVEVLSEHIEDLKQAITPPGGPPDPFAEEVRRAARLVCNPPGGDRIGATLEWIGLQLARGGARGGGGRGADESFCDECGATLGIVSDGDGSPPRLFCLQCQPEELAHASVAPPAPCPQCKQPGRVADVTANTFTCDACGSVWQRRAPVRVRPAGTVRVRELTEDEHVAMKAYLEFVQREPLPTTDAAARHRLEEAAVNWPQMAAMFEPHIEELAEAIAEAESHGS